jgi:hypothetical protein
LIFSYEYPGRQNGVLATYLKTPRVQQVVRAFFNCSSLVGAELENNAGATIRTHIKDKNDVINVSMPVLARAPSMIQDTAYTSHWEKRLFPNGMYDRARQFLAMSVDKGFAFVSRVTTTLEGSYRICVFFDRKIFLPVAQFRYIDIHIKFQGWGFPISRRLVSLFVYDHGRCVARAFLDRFYAWQYGKYLETFCVIKKDSNQSVYIYLSIYLYR